MKHIFVAILSLSLLASCQKTKKAKTEETPKEHAGHDHNHDHGHSPDHAQEALTPEQQSEQNLFNEVMAIHDSIMPEMGTIMKYKREFKKDIDSLQTKKLNPERVKVLQKQIEQLDQADKGMMTWMRAFDTKKTVDHPHQEVMEYLNGEKKKISTVKKEMEKAIQDASKQ